jgi:16S rRNA (uracil1498-N3)-methyltransferase
VTPPLFRCDPLPAGDVVVLDGPEGHHAARVRRVAVGESVQLGDGRGAALHCVVSAVTGGRVTLEVRSRRFEPEPDPRVVVVQALAKGDRSELAVELLTELGADEIVPWNAARSVVHWRDDQPLRRWRRAAEEAAKQSRRIRVPVITELASTAGIARMVAAARLALVLHQAGRASLRDVVVPASGQLLLVVGPEGGITDDELRDFQAGVSLRLGESVLRTSTAGAAALAALSQRLGRWQ